MHRPLATALTIALLSPCALVAAENADATVARFEAAVHRRKDEARFVVRLRAGGTMTSRAEPVARGDRVLVVDEARRARWIDATLVDLDASRPAWRRLVGDPTPDYRRVGLPVELLVIGLSIPLLLTFWPL